MRISLSHHYSLPTIRALPPSDQETDALGSRAVLKQKCDYSIFSTGWAVNVSCSGEEGDPRRRLTFGVLPGLRSCLLLWQILGDSPVFSPHLNTCLEKAATPTDPAVCGNGDRLGGGGETGGWFAEPPSDEGRRVGQAGALRCSCRGNGTPSSRPASLRAQPGSPLQLRLC